MAKAISLYYGNDSFGRAVERAQREDGVWFQRWTVKTAYGNQFCKWTTCDEAPQFITKDVNEYDGSEFELDEPVMMWGFNRLNKLGEKPRVRLPN